MSSASGVSSVSSALAVSSAVCEQCVRSVSGAVCEVLRDHQALALSCASSNPICTSGHLLGTSCTKWAPCAQSLHIVQKVCNPLPVNVTVCAKIAQIVLHKLHKLHKWCVHCTECTRHYPEASADPAEDNSKYSSLIAPQYNAPRTHLSNILAIRGLLMEDLKSALCDNLRPTDMA